MQGVAMPQRLCDPGSDGVWIAQTVQFCRVKSPRSPTFACGTALAMFPCIMNDQNDYQDHSRSPLRRAAFPLAAIALLASACAADQGPADQGDQGDKSDTIGTHRLVINATQVVDLQVGPATAPWTHTSEAVVDSHDSSTVTISGDEIWAWAPDRYTKNIKIQFESDDDNLAMVMEYKVGEKGSWQRVSVDTEEGSTDLFKGIIFAPVAGLASFAWVVPGTLDKEGEANDIPFEQFYKGNVQYRVFVTPTWDAWRWDDGQYYPYTVQIHDTLTQRWGGLLGL